MDANFIDKVTEETDAEIINSIINLKVIHGINEHQD
jgi:hypothetical protein